MTRKKVVKKKIEVVFDPKKRREFLTGFQKRKNERRKRAKDQLDRNLKEERKRIRQEIKDGFKHMKKSFEPLRELTEEDKVNEDEYEDEDVKVKIVELSTNDWARQQNLLGENRAADSSDAEEVDNDDKEEEDDTDDGEENTNCIPGMDFDVAAKRKKRSAPKDEESVAAESENEESGGVKRKKAKTETGLEVKSKKELDRLKKTKTLKKLKKSKAFKMKERLDKKANQKKVKRDRNNTYRSLPKNQRKNKKFEPSRYSKGRMINKKTFRKKQQSRG